MTILATHKRLLTMSSVLVVWVPFVIDKKGVMSVNKDSIDINVPYNKKEDLEKGKYKAIKETSYRIFANFPKVTPAKNKKGKVIAVKGRYPISFEIPKMSIKTL